MGHTSRTAPYGENAYSPKAKPSNHQQIQQTKDQEKRDARHRSHETKPDQRRTKSRSNEIETRERGDGKPDQTTS